MAEIQSKAYAGGTILDHVAEGKSAQVSASISTPGEGRLATWTLDDIVNYLKTGVSRGGPAHSTHERSDDLNSMRH